MYFNYRPRTKYEGRLYFQLVLSVQTRGGGGGLPHLHPIIFPLVPCPFWRDTPVTGPRWSEYLSPRWGEVPQSQAGEVPPFRPGWGTRPARTGVPFPPETGYAWTGYAAGGTPLSVSRRRTLVHMWFLIYAISNNNHYTDRRKTALPVWFGLLHLARGSDLILCSLPAAASSLRRRLFSRRPTCARPSCSLRGNTAGTPAAPKRRTRRIL